jgi:SPP1 family predicted phage head-tail adaptor
MATGNGGNAGKSFPLGSAPMMTALPAGVLDKRLSIEQLSTADDGAGGNTSTYVPLTTVWGRLSSTGGREYFAAKRLNAELTHEATIRFRPDVVAGMRIAFTAASATRVFRIAAPPMDPDERRVKLLLFLKEETA